MIDKLIDPVSKIVNKFVKDKDLQAKLDHELNTLFHEANLAQVKVNLKEAEHKSLFVSGWRPFLGWSLSFLFIYGIAVRDILDMIFKANGIQIDLVEFDIGTLTPILTGMLGLAGMRSYEKTKNVHAK
jgi:hypothetical protein|tara:strand:- start:127 stop:510 length:384 start_codon:yes stop_codon:yes gene_type:complete